MRLRGEPHIKALLSLHSLLGLKWDTVVLHPFALIVAGIVRLYLQNSMRVNTKRMPFFTEHFPKFKPLLLLFGNSLPWWDRVSSPPVVLVPLPHTGDRFERNTVFVPIEEGLVVTTSIKEVDDNKLQSE